MDVSITFKLIDKMIRAGDGERKVLGLAELHVCPKSSGLGRHIREYLQSVARDKHVVAVVGFAGDDVAEFYRKTGWWVKKGAKFDGKSLVSTVELGEPVEIDEPW